MMHSGRLTISFIAILLLTSACGAGLATSGTGQVQPIKTIAREDTLILSAPYQQYKFSPVDNMNPLFYPDVLQSDGANKTVYELLMYTNLLTGELVPWLAESYSTNADYTLYSVKLRPGVTWSDGAPFTCQDIKYTLEMIRDSKPSVSDSDSQSYIRTSLHGVECPDGLTAVIRLKQSTPRFFKDRLASGAWDVITIMPEHIWTSQNPILFKNLSVEKGYPIGTGPYQLVKASEQQMIYDRHDDWWGAKTGFAALPAPKRIIFTAMDTQKYTGLDQMLIENGVDYGPELSTGQYLNAVSQNPKLSAWTANSSNYGVSNGCNFTLNINTQQPPFTDTNIRLAINYAINRQEIVDKGLNGGSAPAVLPFSSYVSKNWMNSDLTNLVDSFQREQANPELVAQYVGAAGYSKTQGIWVKGGEPIRFRMTIPYNLAEIGTIVFDQLTRAGFIVEKLSEPANASSNWGQVLFQGNFDVMLSSHCNSLTDPLESLQDFHRRYYRLAGNDCPDFRSYCRYQNAEMDQWIEQMEKMAPSIKDPQYTQAVAGAVKVFLEEMPEVVLAEARYVYPMNDTYWTGWPNASDPYATTLPWFDNFYLILEKLVAVNK
jgi:peptide/nickel transport system substrate-binding protein